MDGKLSEALGRPKTGEAFELPGRWFTAHELQALALESRAGDGPEVRRA